MELGVAGHRSARGRRMRRTSLYSSSQHSRVVPRGADASRGAGVDPQAAVAQAPVAARPSLGERWRSFFGRHAALLWLATVALFALALGVGYSTLKAPTR